MAITVGLDFGTHQTKVCIENSDDPHHVTYEFFEWEPGVFALPSTIQINKDHTISYGKIDMENVLVERKRKAQPKPMDILLPSMPEKPNFPQPCEREKPPMPTLSLEVDGELKDIPYSELYGIGKTYRAKTDFPEYREWVEKCNLIDDCFDDLHEAWERLVDLCPQYYLPEPELPPLPEEPHLEGYCDDYNPALNATKSQIREYEAWKVLCKKMDDDYDREKFRYEKSMELYGIEVSEWEESCNKIKNIYGQQCKAFEKSKEKLPMVFRYFKQAVFSSYNWIYEINARDLCVLYIANIIFSLERRFGTDFSIQMGVPASENNFQRLKEVASEILIRAYVLVEDIFQNDYDEFLSTPYEDLMNMIPKWAYSDRLKEEYAIIVLPEAYAALRSLTNNSKIPEGMSVMLDIGGGTTDISFFVIESNGEPHTYHFASIAKGLNFFLEYGSNLEARDFTSKMELEDMDEIIFGRAYNDFKSNVDKVIGELTRFLHKDTIIRGFNKRAFKNAILNRPAVYSGGGSYDVRLRKPILDFTDIKHIDKQTLAIPNVVDEKKVNIPYSVLATAYGLSIQREDDNIMISKKEDLFAKYTNVDERESRWNTHLEHGMYED